MSTLATSGISPIGGFQNSASGFAGEVMVFFFLVFALSRLTFSSDTVPTARPGLLNDPEFRLGLGLVALLQLAIWMGGGWLALNQSGNVATALTDFTLPAGFAIWAVLYFLFGYILYASVLGALGALAPNVREGTQFTFLAILPLLVPIWLNTAFTQAPDGALATALSLFPLTAPTAMVTRLSISHVPLWQPVVSLAGLAGTTYLFVLLSGRFFRADTLLSDASLNWGRIVREVRGVRLHLTA